jgi:hypothetical protein
MNITLDPNLPWLAKRIIFLTKHGSHAYGLATPDSDVDIRGIAIAPLSYHFGFMEKFEQSEVKGGNADLLIQDLRKFIKLASDGNPSVLEVLFTDPADHLLMHPLAKKLIECRDWFLSQKILHTFTGYAMSHVKYMERRANGDTAIPEVNAKRRALYEQFGYDTKDAAHVVRLMRMCKEILLGQGVQVRRPDAAELLDIKNGAWSLQEVISWAYEMDKELHILRENSKLPPSPDRKLINELCVELVASSFVHQINIPVMMKGFQHQTWAFETGTLVEKLLSGSEA